MSGQATLRAAYSGGTALGAFTAYNIEFAQAIITAGESLDIP
jgi:hypothetical protein